MTWSAGAPGRLPGVHGWRDLLLVLALFAFSERSLTLEQNLALRLVHLLKDGAAPRGAADYWRAKDAFLSALLEGRPA